MSHFPFTAIVGLELAKKSLLYHAIDPRLGGTLLLGHRGCAKSTLVRAFAPLLSTANEKPAPFCEVPLGTSEDRLLGSVDAESLVEKQQWQVRAGLLEKANGGILYIDEVNLLPDHLSDLILDSAASGVHHLERDGITRVIESRYILVGTMNPEEGELRPQLLDRFAHGVRIHDDFSEDERMEIIQKRLAFDDAPSAFGDQHRRDEDQIKKRIDESRRHLTNVVINDEQRRAIAQRGRELKVEGMRTELAVIRTARAAAAWKMRTEISSEDIEEAWALCLGHRQSETQTPSAPNPPRPSASGQTPTAAPDKKRSGAISSSAPLQARSQPVEVRSETLDSSHAFSTWWNSPVQPAKHKLGSGQSFDSKSQTPILWLASVLSSVPGGWLSRQGPLRLCRSRHPIKRSLWIFLDASRSTGMTRFLGKALSFLQDVGRFNLTNRVHVLLLRENRLQWLSRNQSFVTAIAALSDLRSAAGGSHLAEALANLNRSMLRKRQTQPWAMLFTDGLNCRSKDETTGESIARMRLAMRRVEAGSSALAWAYPKPHVGIANLSERFLPDFSGTRWPL